MAKRAPDIRKLARRQRWIIWLLLLWLVSQFLFFAPWGRLAPVIFFPLAVIQMAILVALMVGVVLLLVAQGTHVLIVILLAILMIAPCGSLLILLAVDMSATRTLRRVGLKVGFMGVKDEEVERLLNPMLCKGCGYDLTGNVSGICSECGRPIG